MKFADKGKDAELGPRRTPGAVDVASMGPVPPGRPSRSDSQRLGELESNSQREKESGNFPRRDGRRAMPE